MNGQGIMDAVKFLLVGDVMLGRGVNEALVRETAAYPWGRRQDASIELWRLTDDDYQAILRHRDEHSLRQALAIRRGQNIINDAVQKVRSGLTSLQEIKGLGIGLSKASDFVNQSF